VPPNPENVDTLVSGGGGGPFSFVVDCIDTLQPKVELIRSALKHKTRVVSSMGAVSTPQTQAPPLDCGTHTTAPNKSATFRVLSLSLSLCVCVCLLSLSLFSLRRLLRALRPMQTSCREVVSIRPRCAGAGNGAAPRDEI
jgi:hypothetical protein